MTAAPTLIMDLLWCQDVWNVTERNNTNTQLKYVYYIKSKTNVREK